MNLADHVTTFGQDLLRRYGERIHKLTLHTGFTCPTRDGSKGRGGCTFCNNAAFSPNLRRFSGSMEQQFASGRRAIADTTRAKRYLAYFQAYTNTYAEVEQLRQLYDRAVAQTDIVGLCVGTRPDCVPEAVLELLASYQDRGYEVWLELGLQSAFDETLERVQRGHDFAAYRDAVRAAHRYGLPVCTHLIVGLPGEGHWHALQTLERILDLGLAGIKLHPLHVVKHTLLAKQWQQGGYQALEFADFIHIAADMVERTPPAVVYHRLTATAPLDILLAPTWCAQKWPVINALTEEFVRRGSRQGSALEPTTPARRLLAAAAETAGIC